jgi:hypothetical protein
VHTELEGQVKRDFEDFTDSMIRRGVPMAVSSISTVDNGLFNRWNDPEALARIAEDVRVLWESDDLTTRLAQRNLTNDEGKLNERGRRFEQIAKARIHELALEGPTPSPFTANDLGSAERSAAAGYLRDGMAPKEALSKALEDDAQDGDADVQGPLAGEGIDLGIVYTGDLEPDQVQSRAREIARAEGLLPKPSPVTGPTSARSTPETSGGLSIAAAIATVLFAGTLGLIASEVL